MPSLPSLPSHLTLPSRASKWKAVILGSLNFYRVHLIAFTIIPLITSGVMYACNTEYHIAYIDCLFVCMSAMTVTGLASVNLSTLSVVQQTMLFVQMVIGSLTFVSIVMILVRQYFFRQMFKHVIRQRENSRFRISKTLSRVATSGPPLSAIKKKWAGFRNPNRNEPGSTTGSPNDPSPTPSSIGMKPIVPSSAKKDENHKPKKKKHQKLRTDMIKRVSGGGVGLVNPMGWYDAERAEIHTPAPTPEMRNTEALPSTDVLMADNGRQLSDALQEAVDNGQAQERELQRATMETPVMMTDSPMDLGSEDGPIPPSPPPRKTPYAGLQLADDAFPRSKTIAFDDEMDDSHDYRDRDRASTTQRESGAFPRTATLRSAAGESRFPNTATLQYGAGNFPRTYSLRPTTSHRTAEPAHDPRMSGFGGFPTPLDVGKKVFHKVFPEASKSLSKTFTMPRTNTINGRASFNQTETKEVSYISFAATVGRNSRFRGLTTEQMDELGGVEYRALRVLLYIVVGYFTFIQLAGFVIIAPYIAANSRYEATLADQPRHVRVPWFAFFQSVSAYSNTGMSLCDLSMIPFQKAYLMIVVMIILIFAGNTAFPIFLRCTVWCIYKVTPEASRVRESLRFLLDHPRRCFVYLFPSTQTWYLALVMVGLTLIDWVSFLVLDIGTPAIMSLPVGTRVAAGFLQSVAVRAAGFGIVPLGTLAPAVKVLYVVMMYISVYPIALSVRATNVYEEKSLGLFDEDKETELDDDESGAQAVAKYVGWHARRQLAFDIWWLGFALWLVCIIERRHIDNDEEWFNIFNIIFELVSAYGTVGLSLGVPYDNFSFSGGFRKLSKLVVIAVMLRGRHRGLPVAIDRAVMLPKDFSAAEETAFDEERSRRASRRGSLFTDEVVSRPGSFDIPSEAHQEAFWLPGPATAIPLPHQLPQPHLHLPGHRRSSSFGGSTTASMPSGSPTMLQFSMPREGDRERRPPPTAGGMRTGALTPVRESTSRAPMQTEGRPEVDSATEV